MFFLMISIFALVNILAGMFLDTGVRLSKPDNEEHITEAWMQQASDLVELSCILEAMDAEHSDVITKESSSSTAATPSFSCFLPKWALTLDMLRTS